MFTQNTSNLSATSKMIKSKNLLLLSSALSKKALSFVFGITMLSLASVHSAQAQVLLEGAEAPTGTISGGVDTDGDGDYSDGTWSIVNTPASAVDNTAFPSLGGVAMKYRETGSYDINAAFNLTFNDPELTYQLVAYGNEGTNGGYESKAASYTFSWVGGAGTAQVFDPAHDQIDDSATITTSNSITIFQNLPPAGQEACAWRNDITRNWRNRCLEWYVVMPNGATGFTINAVGGSATEGYRFSVFSYADLIVNKTVSASTLNVGEAGFFTINVTNENISGNSVALGTSLTDLLPTGLTFTGSTIVTDGANSGGSYDDTTGEWDLGRLSLGETASLQINFTADASAVNQTITNTIDPASINASQTDPADNHASLSASVNITEAINPSLSMTKVADNTGPHTVGDVITYTYTVTNDGNQNINDVAITDTHNGSDPAPTPGNETLLADNGTAGDSTDTTSDGSWDILAPGDVVTFTGTYTVTAADVANL